MNIGFDLDRVFINYPPLVPGSVIEKFYKKKSNGELLYTIPKRPGQIIRTLLHHPILRQPMKNNLSFLKSIPKEKHHMYLISSRFGFLQKRTEHIVNTYHLDKIFDGLYFNYDNKQPHLFKNDIIKKLNLDVYIDDDFPLLKYVAKNNKHTKFYWLNPKRKPQQLTKNIFSIKKLSDSLS